MWSFATLCEMLHNGVWSKMMVWKCSLCNIELPNDELADIRKERHREFHIDESVGTTNRRRNWTFGEVEFVLC